VNQWGTSTIFITFTTYYELFLFTIIYFCIFFLVLHECISGNIIKVTTGNAVTNTIATPAPSTNRGQFAMVCPEKNTFFSTVAFSVLAIVNFHIRTFDYEAAVQGMSRIQWPRCD
jgi:hypothetical protein